MQIAADQWGKTVSAHAMRGSEARISAISVGCDGVVVYFDRPPLLASRWPKAKTSLPTLRRCALFEMNVTEATGREPPGADVALIGITAARCRFPVFDKAGREFTNLGTEQTYAAIIFRARPRTESAVALVAYIRSA